MQNRTICERVMNFEQLATEFWNSCVTKEIVKSYEEEEGAEKVLNMFAKWLDSRCSSVGAGNTAGHVYMDC